MIPDNVISEVLARTDLATLIGERVALAKAGDSLKGLCPFHAENSPSFVVYDDHYHCYGCGAHGNAANFLMAAEGLDFRGAMKLLGSRAGLPFETNTPGARASGPESGSLLSRVACRYQSLLWEAPGNAAPQAFLMSRGISEEEALRFELGWAPDAWDTLCRDEKYSRAGLVSAGLAKKRPGNRGSYDFFRGRLMFPIRDERGDHIGFGGRVLDGSKPKYINTPETADYKKAQVLYGLYEARDAIRREQCVVVVEGYLDVIQPAGQGMQNCVATCGTALTRDHFERLLDLTPRIVLCLDGDRAGRSATWEILSKVVAPSCTDTHEINVAILPDKHDPDSFCKQEGVAAFRQLTERAPSFWRYMLDQLVRDADSPDGKSRALYRAIDLWARLNSSALSVFMREALIERLGLTATQFDLLAGQRGRLPRSNLKPCPCCAQSGTPVNEDGGWLIRCSACGLVTRSCADIDAATMLWNRRERFSMK